MKDAGSCDTKPRNYNYLSFKIISALSQVEKIELLKDLEQMLLKSLLRYKPRENWITLERVQIFSGKDRAKELTVWYSQLAPEFRTPSRILQNQNLRFD